MWWATGHPRAQWAPTMHLCSLPALDFSALMQHQEKWSGVRPLGRALVQIKEFRASWAPFVPIAWDCLEHRGICWDLQSQLCPYSYKQACAHGLNALALHPLTQLIVTFMKPWLSRTRNYFSNRDWVSLVLPFYSSFSVICFWWALSCYGKSPANT